MISDAERCKEKRKEGPTLRHPRKIVPHWCASARDNTGRFALRMVRVYRIFINARPFLSSIVY